MGPNGKAAAAPGKWEVKEAKKYNADADGLAGDAPAAIAPLSAKKERKEKKDKKDKKIKEESPKKPLIQEVEEEESGAPGMSPTTNFSKTLLTSQIQMRKWPTPPQPTERPMK